MKLLIIGGVAGGASAATRARRLSESAEIILIERGKDVSFANCGLPYFIGGEITSRDKLLVSTAERLRTRFKLDVRERSCVEAIDPASKCVRIRDVSTGREYTESYDKLILAPGAAPVKPSLPGVELPGFYTLRNLQDMDRIKSRVDCGATSAVIIGAGFIGLELAENLVKRGVDTTVIELQKQVLPPLDVEMTTPILQTLQARGVRMHLGDSAEAFEDANGKIQVKLKSGRRLSAALVILGVGVRPENQLAVTAGLEVGMRGGIRVNEYLQTSDPDIFAAGDAIEVRDYVTGEPTQVPLAGPANRQGRIAADNVFGRNVRYRGTQGTAIVRVFDKTAALTGTSEKTLQRSQRPYRVAYVHPSHHASYYPGAEAMTIKLLFDSAEGRVLGAQIVGGTGVDKRIDVLAVAIRARMTVFDLEELELAYSPQYGSAKDPVNMAGFVAAGLLRGDHPQVGIQELGNIPPGSLIDVRTKAEFDRGSIPGAVNIPIDELRSRLSEVPDTHPIVCFCQVGQRGYLATRILLQHNRMASNLAGGYQLYLMSQGSPNDSY